MITQICTNEIYPLWGVASWEWWLKREIKKSLKDSYQESALEMLNILPCSIILTCRFKFAYGPWSPELIMTKI